MNQKYVTKYYLNLLKEKENNLNKFGRYSRNWAGTLFRKYNLVKEDCVLCGSNHNIHLHHENYDVPFFVTFLCANCHRTIHSGKRDCVSSKYPIIKTNGGTYEK